VGEPFVIGVTGGIATGKSTVLAELARLGATTVDADRVYHELIAPGRPLRQALRERFGPAIVAQDGQIDRARLGRIVFADPALLRELERLTHPAVIAEIERRIAEAPTPVVAVDGVKLIESGFAKRCDEVWLVTAPRDIQRARLVARNALTPEDAERRLAAQPDDASRRPHADRVMDNSGTRERLAQQVDRAWRELELPQQSKPQSLPNA
jgi:dephospho-CoA kinase